MEEVQHAKELGIRAAWLQTHNAYTQASSEGGIPAFLFFTGALVACFRTNLRIQKRAADIPELKPAANMAFGLFVLCAGFAVNIFFSPIAYRYYLPTLAGITIVLSQHVNRELSNRGLRPLQDRR